MLKIYSWTLWRKSSKIRMPETMSIQSYPVVVSSDNGHEEEIHIKYGERKKEKFVAVSNKMSNA